MACTVKAKTVATNPLKLGQPLGGVLALQGFYRSMPLIHGAQGCAAFIKALMTRHFREPIAMQTSALHEMNVIFGGEASLRQGLDTVISKHKPDLVAVISTSLTEVSGEDFEGSIRQYRKDHNLKDTLLVTASIPDFEGSLETGYAKTVEAVIKGITEQYLHGIPSKKTKGRVNLLPGSHLTPGDVMELKEIISSFGLEVITIPDLSTSLSGHLLTGHSALSRGGIPTDYLKQALTSEHTIVVGGGMERAAKVLEDKAGIPYKVFGGLLGLQDSDDFFGFLQAVSRQEVPVRYRWEREFLLDSMLDAHFVYGGKKILMALEPDHLASVSRWLEEMGAHLQGLVAPCRTPVLDKMDHNVIIGDLGDLEDCGKSGADLWISNSHGEQSANRMGIPFVPYGFPLFDRFGSALEVSVGYRGTTEMVNKIANVLFSGERRKH